MTDTRTGPGESPYGAAYGLQSYPSPAYGDPLTMGASDESRRQAWASGAQPSADAWGAAQQPDWNGPATQAAGWDASQTSGWGAAQPAQPAWGAAQPQAQPAPQAGALPYGNPISPPYGVPSYPDPSWLANGAPAAEAAPAQYADPSYGFQSGQAAAAPYQASSYPGQGAEAQGQYPGVYPGGYPSGQFDAQASQQLPAQPYGAPSGQYPAQQYAAPQAPAQYPGQPAAGYPATELPYGYQSGQFDAQAVQQAPTSPYGAPSGQYPAQPYAGQYQAQAPTQAPYTGQYPGQAPSGQYPAQAFSGQYPAQAPSGQYPAQAFSGQYPAQAPSGQYPAQAFSGQFPAQSGPYPVAAPGVVDAAASGQFPLPSWSSPTGSALVPVRRGQLAEIEAPTGQHERIGKRKSSRVDARIETARVAADEDARFLDAIKTILSLPSLFPRVLFVALGFTAIGPLALAYVEVLPLPVSGRFILLPAAAIVIMLGMRFREWGRRALIGWGAGIIATIIYDCLRLGLVQVGIWGDPIPGIGRLLLDDPNAHWAWGYAWRFLGNGGGMAIAFTMMPWRGVRAGVIYGTMICLGLVAVLAFWPISQAHFFPLTPITAAGGMAGHWIYGAVLGFITGRLLPPVRALKSEPDEIGEMEGYRPAHAMA